MSSSNQEPKKFFAGFNLEDYFIIFVCSDLISSGILVLFGGAFPWALILGGCIWWLHEFNTRNQIATGRR